MCFFAGVMLYCRHGAHRSATVAAAWLMARFGATCSQAMRFLVRVRNIVTFDKRTRYFLTSHEKTFRELFKLRIAKYKHLPLPTIGEPSAPAASAATSSEAPAASAATSSQASGPVECSQQTEDLRRDEQERDRSRTPELAWAQGDENLYRDGTSEELQSNNQEAVSTGEPKTVVVNTAVVDFEVDAEASVINGAVVNTGAETQMEGSPAEVDVESPVASASASPVASASASTVEQRMQSMAAEIERLTTIVKKHDDRLAVEAHAEAARALGDELIQCFLQRDAAGYGAILGGSRGQVDLTVTDCSGMTALHFACRLQANDIVEALLKKQPQLVNVLTHVTRTPSNWTCLQCLCDAPRAQTQEEQRQHANMAAAVAEAMSVDRLLHFTKQGPPEGTSAVHQVVSRGHFETLKVLLPVYLAKARWPLALCISI